MIVTKKISKKYVDFTAIDNLSFEDKTGTKIIILLVISSIILFIFPFRGSKQKTLL